MTVDLDRDDRFRVLFDAYARDVRRYLARRTASLGNGDVDDLLEEVFLVAYRRIDEVATAASPRAWLFAVARKQAANYFRTSSRRRSILERFVRPPAPVVDLAQAVVFDDAVRAALESLSPSDRELLELIAFDELTVTEVAEMLHLSPATVSVRLHRARSRCKSAYLAGLEPDEARGLVSARPAPVSVRVPAEGGDAS